MLQDLYAEAGRCVLLLRENGFAAEAEALDRGLHGATSGEALALIGAAARDAVRGRRDLPPAVRERLGSLRRNVDAVLRSPR